MKRIGLVLFLFLMLSSLCYSQWATNMRNEIYNQWSTNSWEVIAGIALLIALFSAVIAYMVASLLGSPELKRWAKVEIYNVIGSAVLVLALIVIVDLLLVSASEMAFEISNTSYPPVPLPVNVRSSPFGLAHYYLDIQLACIKKYYVAIFILNFPLEIIEKTVIPTGGMEEVAGWPLSGPVGLLYWFEHQFTFALIATYFQRHLLVFLEDNMFTLFLPLGIVLRILPWTRGAGGVIIALAIGLFIVFPTMYGVLLVMLPRADCAAAIPSPYTCETADVTCMNFAISYLEDERHFISIENFLNNVSMELDLLMVSSLIFPLINLTITITFVRAIMQFLGADVAEMGHGIVKII